MNYNVTCTVLQILVYCINFLDRARLLMKQDGNKKYLCHLRRDKVYKNQLSVKW